jgi:hypothetical protein
MRNTGKAILAPPKEMRGASNLARTLFLAGRRKLLLPLPPLLLASPSDGVTGPASTTAPGNKPNNLKRRKFTATALMLAAELSSFSGPG